MSTAEPQGSVRAAGATGSRSRAARWRRWLRASSAGPWRLLLVGFGVVALVYSWPGSSASSSPSPSPA